MLQVVCIKQVADTETRVKVAADGKTLDPAGVTWILFLGEQMWDDLRIIGGKAAPPAPRPADGVPGSIT